MRPQMVNSVVRSCVTMTTVMPRLSLSCRISASMPLAAIGSRSEVGSSRNRIFGSSASARANAARFTMPPDSADGNLTPVSAGNPASASFIAAICSCSSSGSAVCSRIGSMMFCATDSEENSAPC